MPVADHLPPSPVTYEDIPFGAGQEPRVYGMFQFSKDYGMIDPKSVRRTPGYDHIIVSGRWPERPV